MGLMTIIPQYSPYPKLTPALADLVLNKQINDRAVYATVVDLAVREYINISYYKGKLFEFSIPTENGKISGDHVISVKRTSKKDDDLLGYEKLILSEFFKDEKKEFIGVSFTYHLPKKKIISEIYKESVRQGLFKENPEEKRKKILKITKILEKVGFYTALIIIGFFIIAGSWIFFALRNQFIHRTKKGKEVFKWNKGLKLFIHHAERYRLERGDIEPHKLLAYAIVFDQLDKWKQHFKLDESLKVLLSDLK